jgi:hypothetical protein
MDTVIDATNTSAALNSEKTNTEWTAPIRVHRSEH